MILFIISFLAGVLTVLTPCVLPILPVVLGGTVGGERDRSRPFIVTISLGLSVFIFTLLLKVSSIFINVPPTFWQYLSATIIVLFGLSLLFPDAWANLTNRFEWYRKSNVLLAKSYKEGEKPGRSKLGSILIGASLGPVFTTCSPTFFVILATVLPASFFLGITYLFAYVLGLSLFLLAIAFIGQNFLLKISSLSDPNSKTMKTIGVIFLLLGVAIAFGIDKKVESDLLNNSGFDYTSIENKIRNSLENSGQENANQNINLCFGGSCTSTSPGSVEIATSTSAAKKVLNVLDPSYKTIPYKELVDPSGFVNSAPFQLKDLIGKKVILVDFMTYSCINCQRTYPYLKDWYAKYKDQGLEIVAIQTPEFSFEKKLENVQESAKENGLTFPIVLDNDYGTWNAYQNQYWPHKYLIDINGNIVYDHIGEGNYKETEEAIVKLLKQRGEVFGTKVSDMSASTTDYSVFAASPETYFGAMRNEYLANGLPSISGAQDFTLPNNISLNKLYLSGKWDIENEYAAPSETGASITYEFNAKNVYLVAESSFPLNIEITLDGVKMPDIQIKESKLYNLISLPTPGTHTLKVTFPNTGPKIYTFTFG